TVRDFILYLKLCNRTIITNRKLFTYVTKELATNSLVAHIDYNDTPSQISNIQTIISNIKEEKYRKIFDKI
ncbi:hypothetical protein LL996_08285, partial [Streptococcus agalactiae]|nr:hypothetical protein [Streptococcus agalactiae]